MNSTCIHHDVEVEVNYKEIYELLKTLERGENFIIIMVTGIMVIMCDWNTRVSVTHSHTVVPLCYTAMEKKKK